MFWATRSRYNLFKKKIIITFLGKSAYTFNFVNIFLMPLCQVETKVKGHKFKNPWMKWKKNRTKLWIFFSLTNLGFHYSVTYNLGLWKKKPENEVKSNMIKTVNIKFKGYTRNILKSYNCMNKQRCWVWHRNK